MGADSGAVAPKFGGAAGAGGNPAADGFSAPKRAAAWSSIMRRSIICIPGARGVSNKNTQKYKKTKRNIKRIDVSSIVVLGKSFANTDFLAKQGNAKQGNAKQGNAKQGWESLGKWATASNPAIASGS